MAINGIIQATDWKGPLKKAMNVKDVERLEVAVRALQEYSKNVTNCNCIPSNCCQSIACEKHGNFTYDDYGNILRIDAVCQLCQSPGPKTTITTCQKMTCQQITCQIVSCETCQYCESECNVGCETCQTCQSQCWCESCQQCQIKYCEEFECQSLSCQEYSCQTIGCENILCQSIKRKEI